MGAHFGQLLANMLKLATDLTYEAAISGNCLSELHIYGLLVDIEHEKAWPMSLKMSLSLKANPIVSLPRHLEREALNFNEALHRLSHLI